MTHSLCRNMYNRMQCRVNVELVSNIQGIGHGLNWDCIPHFPSWGQRFSFRLICSDGLRGRRSLLCKEYRDTGNENPPLPAPILGMSRTTPIPNFCVSRGILRGGLYLQLMWEIEGKHEYSQSGYPASSFEPRTFRVRNSTAALSTMAIYRVTDKSLRGFRNRLRDNQDRHGRKEHINR